MILHKIVNESSLFEKCPTMIIPLVATSALHDCVSIHNLTLDHSFSFPPFSIHYPSCNPRLRMKLATLKNSSQRKMQSYKLLNRVILGPKRYFRFFISEQWSSMHYYFVGKYSLVPSSYNTVDIKLLILS